MAAPVKSNKGTSSRRRHAISFNVWAMNGQPLPESTIRKFDEAMQRVMDSSKIRLAASCVKE